MERKTRLFSYVVRYDTGLAPNPFGGYCTLALCKWKIRLAAQKGDWVVGTGSKSRGMEDRLIYAMLVTEKLDLNDYYTDKRFSKKIPNADNIIGDNIYLNGEQKHSFMHGPGSKKDDLEKGKYVLISGRDNYYYFGKNAIEIRSRFPWIIKTGPNYKSNFTDPQIASFVDWLRSKHPPGRHGLPIDYKGKAVCG